MQLFHKTIWRRKKRVAVVLRNFPIWNNSSMHIMRESKEARLPWEEPVIICRGVSTRLMTSVDGERFRRVALLVTLTQRFRVVLSFASLFSLRLIILNHNHARSSRRSDRLRFIAGINVVCHASQPYYVCQSRSYSFCLALLLYIDNLCRCLRCVYCTLQIIFLCSCVFYLSFLI